MSVFQPTDATGEGAQAMVDDGIFKRFPKPDVFLAQGVIEGAAGVLSSRSGVVTSTGAYRKATLAGTDDSIPTNRNSHFAPVVHPTLPAGVEALVVAAECWLSA